MYSISSPVGQAKTTLFPSRLVWKDVFGTPNDMSSTHPSKNFVSLGIETPSERRSTCKIGMENLFVIILLKFLLKNQKCITKIVNTFFLVSYVVSRKNLLL